MRKAILLMWSASLLGCGLQEPVAESYYEGDQQGPAQVEQSSSVSSADESGDSTSRSSEGSNDATHGFSSDALPRGPGYVSSSKDGGVASRPTNVEEVSDSADPTCYKAQQRVCAIEKAIVKYTNQKRREVGLIDLVYSPSVGFVARAWSKEQEQAGMISHDGFPDQRTELYDSEFPNFNVFLTAENVAYVSVSGMTEEAIAELFVELWWESPGHQKNMTGDYEVLGAGIFQSGNLIYATQLFGVN